MLLTTHPPTRCPTIVCNLAIFSMPTLTSYSLCILRALLVVATWVAHMHELLATGTERHPLQESRFSCDSGMQHINVLLGTHVGEGFSIVALGCISLRFCRGPMQESCSLLWRRDAAV